MKVLLLGDYSSLHFNLYKGLISLNHEVDLASTGDSRGIPSTHSLSPSKFYNNRFIDGALRLKREFDFVNSLGNYDVIQIINPHILSNYHPFNLYLKLRKKAKKLILISAGIDKFYLNNREKHFDYYYDFKVKNLKLKSKIEDQLLSLVDGVITTSFTYKKVHEDNPKFIENIGFPIIIDNEINFLQKKKIFTFYHGNSEQRFKEKGSNFIRDSFIHLNSKYKNRHQFLVAKPLPFKEYIKLLNDKIDCVVDQTYAYDPGMNALIAMAKGKIVFGGCENTYMESLPINKPPLINIKPSKLHIINQIDYFLDNLDGVNEMSKEGYNFVSDYHDHIKISEKYIKTWKMI